MPILIIVMVGFICLLVGTGMTFSPSTEKEKTYGPWLLAIFGLLLFWIITGSVQEKFDKDVWWYKVSNIEDNEGAKYQIVIIGDHSNFVNITKIFGYIIPNRNNDLIVYRTRYIPKYPWGINFMQDKEDTWSLTK